MFMDVNHYYKMMNAVNEITYQVDGYLVGNYDARKNMDAIVEALRRWDMLDD